MFGPVLTPHMRDALAETVLDQLETPLAVLDTEGTVVDTNEPWSRLDVASTLPGTTAAGDPFLPACSAVEHDVEQVRGPFVALLSGECDQVDTAYTAPRPDAFPRRFRVRGRRFTADDEYLLVEHAETTGSARVERERDHYRAVLADVATVVSHDLRSPLTAALSWAELLATDPDTDVETVSRIVSAVERLDSIADAAVTLARETHVSSLDAVDTGAVARRVWEDIDTAGRLVVETTGPVLADEHALEVLLRELLRNAVQHGTDDGTPVTVRLEPLPDGFSLQDDGSGIHDGLQETLFEPGVTTAAAENTSGIGLAIVERAVEAHGWTVDCTDADGGARFEITGVRRPSNSVS